jgi:20S proteasome subunit alpha 4
MEDAPSVDYIARYVAKVQQQYTQQGGVRPFGIATLMAGIGADPSDPDAPSLYQTDPAGTQSRWKAQVIGGRNSKSLREFLEKQYQANMSEQQCIRLAIQSLLEVVDSGAKTMELCILRRGGSKEIVNESIIESIIAEIEAEQQQQSQPSTATTTAVST